MKSNISKKDIDSGKEIIEKLSELNPKLLPHILKEIIPDYKKFSPNFYKYGIWSSTKIKNKKYKQKYDKIMLLINGVTAGGKDALHEEMEKLAPNLFLKTVTATSRPPRKGEVEGKDYFFHESHTTFRQSIKNGEFLEYIKRGETFYGLPKKSLDNAINNSNPVIYSQLELSGWSKAEKYITSTNQTNILVLKVFIMPDMNFSDYKNWLTEKRNDSELESRLNKTGWEIKKAPKKADIIVTNRIRKDIPALTYTAQSIINHLTDLLNSSEFSKFPIPFDTDQELKDLESILNFHDSIK